MLRHLFLIFIPDYWTQIIVDICIRLLIVLLFFLIRFLLDFRFLLFFLQFCNCFFKLIFTITAWIIHDVKVAIRRQLHIAIFQKEIVIIVIKSNIRVIWQWRIQFARVNRAAKIQKLTWTQFLLLLKMKFGSSIRQLHFVKWFRINKFMPFLNALKGTQIIFHPVFMLILTDSFLTIISNENIFLLTLINLNGRAVHFFWICHARYVYHYLLHVIFILITLWLTVLCSLIVRG